MARGKACPPPPTSQSPGEIVSVRNRTGWSKEQEISCWIIQGDTACLIPGKQEATPFSHQDSKARRPTEIKTVCEQFNGGAYKGVPPLCVQIDFTQLPSPQVTDSVWHVARMS